MKLNNRISFILLACLLPAFTNSSCNRWQTAPAGATLADCKKAHEDDIAKIEAENRKAMESWQVQYQEDLKTLEQNFQTAGKLEGLVAVRKEIARFAESKQVPESAVVQAPKELAGMQKNVLKLLQAAAAAKTKQVARSTAGYMAVLEGLMKSLTVEGKIEAAQAVSAELEKLKQAQFARPPSAVRTAMAIQTNAPILIDAFGNTRDRANADIVPQVSGILLKTLIHDGDTVTNGQPMFLIDPSDYAARVRQAEGVVKADRANLELSRSTLERNKILFEKKLISEETFDSLKTRVSAVEGQVQMDEAALEQARLSLARCTVTAPMAGVCSKRYVDEGNLVGAGQSRLTNIRSYDPMIVEFSISEQYLPLIRQAMAEGSVRLEFTPRGATNRFTGTVTFVDNSVNPMSGTILLRGEAPNPDLKIWAGQFVDATVDAGVVKNAVMVPEGAVQFGKRGPYLYTVKDGKADMRPVKTGIRVGQLLQIVDGVAPGEAVVVLGQLMLYPGASVAEAPQQQQQPQQPAAKPIAAVKAMPDGTNSPAISK